MQQEYFELTERGLAEEYECMLDILAGAMFIESFFGKNGRPERLTALRRMYKLTEDCLTVWVDATRGE